MNKKKPTQSPSTASKSFSALVRGIQHAAASASAVSSRHMISILDQFFDEKDGQLHAKMTYVEVDENHWMPVPLISLITPSALTLDKMKVDLSVRIDESFVKPAAFESDDADLDRLALRVSFASSDKDKNTSPRIANVEVEFKSVDSPDAINRIIESYSNMIRPMNKEEHKLPTDHNPPASIKRKDQGEQTAG